ncbi:hypothetical protein [Devosia sp. CAU 1758]
MFILARLLARLGRLFAPERLTPNPNCMSLHDWADLPPHHPHCQDC